MFRKIKNKFPFILSILVFACLITFTICSWLAKAWVLAIVCSILTFLIGIILTWIGAYGDNFDEEIDNNPRAFFVGIFWPISVPSIIFLMFCEVFLNLTSAIFKLVVKSRTKQTIVAASGYFNPIHKGHIEYLRRAKSLGDKLIVIVNNDMQVNLKGSVPFMTVDERLLIVKSIKYVDEVIESVDQDTSVCETLELVKPDIFAKGGDRNTSNIPEKQICDKLRIQIIDGLGDKIQSSSVLLSDRKLK